MYKLFVQVFVVALFLLPTLLLSHCANRMAPTGGPRDSLTPYIISSIPANQSTNYNGDIVVVEFNEWIREKQLRQQLLITPPTKEYTSRVVRTRIEIRFNNPLEENTTYSLNFREGIEDITEGNTAVLDTISKKPLKIAFSTGDIIDSLSVSGQIYDRLTNENLEKILISLYNVDDTLSFDKDTPYYFTISDAEGNFAIDNIKAGTYRVYAIQDENLDLIYQASEGIDFFPEPIQLGDSVFNLQEVELKIALEDHAPPELLRSRAEGRYYDLAFDEPIGQITAQTIPSDTLAYTDSLTYQIQSDPKIVRFYNLQAVYDSIPIQIIAEDTLSNQLIDTLKIAFLELNQDNLSRRAQRNANQKSRFNAQISFVDKTKQDSRTGINYLFTKPVKRVDFSRFSYLPDQDSTRLGPLFVDSLTSFSWNKSRTLLSIKRETDFEQGIQISTDSLTFISIEDDTLLAQTASYVVKDPGQFGSIYGTIATSEPHYIVQLLDSRKQVINQVIDQKNYEFAFLPAGNYEIRIILDRNQNGKWDNSDVKNNIPAEEILFRVLPNEGRLREKWDIEAIITF